MRSNRLVGVDTVYGHRQEDPLGSSSMKETGDDNSYTFYPLHYNKPIHIEVVTPVL